MICEHNESQSQIMALRPKLAGYSVRGPEAQGDAMPAPCQTPCGPLQAPRRGKHGFTYRGGQGAAH